MWVATLPTVIADYCAIAFVKWIACSVILHKMNLKVYDNRVDSSGDKRLRCFESSPAIMLSLAVVLLTVACSRAGGANVTSLAPSYNAAVMNLATAAAAAYQSRCNTSVAACPICSFDACGTLQPSDRLCVPSGYGTPSSCTVGGQVRCSYAFPLE